MNSYYVYRWKLCDNEGWIMTSYFSITQQNKWTNGRVTFEHVSHSPPLLQRLNRMLNLCTSIHFTNFLWKSVLGEQHSSWNENFLFSDWLIYAQQLANKFNFSWTIQVIFFLTVEKNHNLKLFSFVPWNFVQPSTIKGRTSLKNQKHFLKFGLYNKILPTW